MTVRKADKEKKKGGGGWRRIFRKRGDRKVDSREDDRKQLDVP